MPKYEVSVTIEQIWLIEADDEDRAFELMFDGKCIYDNIYEVDIREADDA